MQRLLFIIGSVAVLALSFFGTLHFLDSTNFESMDAIRIEHAKEIKAALEKYRAVHGKYPGTYHDNSLADLRADLVDGGFIAKLPVDPYWKSGRVNKYRYRSDTNTYGILLYMELGPCISGIGPSVTGPWDGRIITPCPF